MSGTTDMFGWDLVYRLTKKTITKKEDIIVLFVHWNLVKCGFKCLGVGNSTTMRDTETGSEALPEDWNKDLSYALRYIYGEKLYILRALRTEDDILFNLLYVPDRNISNMSFNVNHTVQSMEGKVEDLIPGYKEISQRIQKDLLGPVFEGVHKEEGTQTAEHTDQRSIDPRQPLTFEPARPRRPDSDAEWSVPPPPDVFSVGRSDLDPFGSGGGMLFNPFPSSNDPLRYPGGIGPLPRGAVPPGARFDPFGPPGLDPRSGPRRGGRGGRGSGFGAPNPDHLPPPGYEDMFM